MPVDPAERNQEPGYPSFSFTCLLRRDVSLRQSLSVDMSNSLDRIYKTTHGVSVSLRLWPAKAGGSKLPWLFWVHGGGFMAGCAERIAPWIHSTLHDYHIVSVNYRFCPEVTFEDQLEDLRDAWQWCHLHLADELGAPAIDVSKSAIGGESAGGTFATLSGFLFEPRPRVIINLYGPVLMSHPQFHEPLSNMSKLLTDVRYSRKRSEEQLEAAMRVNDPTKARSVYPFWFDEEVSNDRLRQFYDMPEFEYGEAEYLRMDLYKYLSITRKRFATVFGKYRYPESEYQNRLDNFSSLNLLKDTASFPPTVLIHGTADTAAPIGPSRLFHEQMESRDWSTKAIWIEGAEHSFDAFITGPEDPGWKEVTECRDFVDHHVHRFAPSL